MFSVVSYSDLDVFDPSIENSVPLAACMNPPRLPYYFITYVLPYDLVVMFVITQNWHLWYIWYVTRWALLITGCFE